jgi:hypothetical protein
MIQIAADNQSVPDLTNRVLSERFSYSHQDRVSEQSDLPTNIAFVGYSAWRREENGDANLSDEQVFVVRDGQVRFLKPRNDLMDHSPDGLSWGYAGSGPTQLALAMLMEVFDDWERVRPIYQHFKDHLVARIPQNTNWTADGADVMALALAIECHYQLGALPG